jgi:methyl-accepting chemotaxis protein
MKTEAWYRNVLVIFGILIVAPLLGFSFAEEPQSEEAKQIKSLVDEAAALVESKGKEEAFAEFRKEGSKWLKGETYIFVIDITGTVRFHPVQPDLEGKNLRDLQDANGKAFVQEMLDLVKTQGSGWVEYMWPKPGETKPSKKLSYIKKATRKTTVAYQVIEETVIVGAGIYKD